MERDVHEEEREHIAGESLDELRKSVDTFLGAKSYDRAACHRALDHILDWHHSKRMHRALDTVLSELKRRRSCAGDREFLRRAGVKP